MAEIVSRQAAKVAANQKMAPNEAYGKKRVVVITSPATAAWAENDTIASPVVLQPGTRVLCDSFVSHGAFGASVVLNVGLRKPDGTVIDADGIAASVDVSAAGRSALNNGALVAGGVDYVLTEPAVIFATLAGGNPTDDAQLRIEVSVATVD